MYHSVLTHCGKCTRIPYNKITNLPIFYTASRMSSLHHFCAKQSYLTQVMSSNPHPTFHSTNLTPAQWQKLYWHEHCAHVGFDQLNTWIRKGSLPCNPRLSQEPNPIYTACQFGKSHKKLRLSNIGHISDNTPLQVMVSAPMVWKLGHWPCFLLQWRALNKEISICNFLG
jgi:hypothetical protein